MKNNVLKILIINLIIFFNFVTFAESATILNSQLPLYCYAANNGRISTYNSVNGTKIGYIDGAVDIIIITKNIGDNWIYGSYPTKKGRKYAYFKITDVIGNVNFSSYNGKTSNNATVYNKVNKEKKFGTVYSTDEITVVSAVGNMFQIIYPINNGYKMGWIQTNNANQSTETKQSSNISEGWYRIATKLDPSKGLDVDNANTETGANIKIWDYVDVSQQKFYVKHISDGWYTIMAGHSNKFLDVHVADNCNVWQFPGNGTNAQLWRFIDCGDGSYGIQSKLGYMLDVYNGNAANGNNVWGFSSNNTNAQKWILRNVSAPSFENSNSSNYVSELNNLINEFNNNPWKKSYAGAVQCKGFASYIFDRLFDTGYIGSGSTSSNPTNYKLNNLNTKVRLVGTLVNYSEGQLKDLLSQAKTGDFLQVQRVSRGPHSMIVVSVDVDNNSINIFDCNSKGDLVVHYYKQSFSTFKNKNRGVSLYTAKDY